MCRSHIAGNAMESEANILKLNILDAKRESQLFHFPWQIYKRSLLVLWLCCILAHVLSQHFVHTMTHNFHTVNSRLQFKLFSSFLSGKFLHSFSSLFGPLAVPGKSRVEINMCTYCTSRENVRHTVTPCLEQCSCVFRIREKTLQGFCKSSCEQRINEMFAK